MSDLFYMERFIFWWGVGSRISVLRSAGRKIVFSGNVDMAHRTLLLSRFGLVGELLVMLTVPSLILLDMPFLYPSTVGNLQ